MLQQKYSKRKKVYLTTGRVTPTQPMSELGKHGYREHVLKAIGFAKGNGSVVQKTLYKLTDYP